MNSIFETESLAYFDGSFSSLLDESIEKFQDTDNYSINFLKSPENQYATFIDFDLNKIFESTSESESNSPQALQIFPNESLDKNLVTLNSEEFNFMKSIESIDYKINDTESSLSAGDTVINIELNSITELETNHTLINLDDSNNLDEISSESESFKVKLVKNF